MSQTATAKSFEGRLDRNALAEVVARDIPKGAYVTLGIGQPTLVSNYLAPDSGVTLHTEVHMLARDGYRPLFPAAPAEVGG